MELDWSAPIKKTTEQDQRSPEWHAFRKKHIGASEIAAVLGESPWSTPYQLWLEKTDQVEGFKGNFATRRGSEAEATIKELYEKKTGRTLVSPVLEYNEWPVLSASLDGWDRNDKLVVEFKYPSKACHAEATVGRVPSRYWYQIQQQMLVAGATCADYVSYDGKDIAIVRVFPNKEQQELLVRKAKEFWGYVERKEAPPTDELQVEDAEIQALLDEYWTLDKEKKQVEYKISGLRDTLREKMKGDKMVCSGTRLSLIHKKGNVAYDEIEVLKTIDLEQYRKPGSVTFKVEKVKRGRPNQ